MQIRFQTLFCDSIAFYYGMVYYLSRQFLLLLMHFFSQSAEWDLLGLVPKNSENELISETKRNPLKCCFATTAVIFVIIL